MTNPRLIKDVPGYQGYDPPTTMSEPMRIAFSISVRLVGASLLAGLVASAGCGVDAYLQCGAFCDPDASHDAQGEALAADGSGTGSDRDGASPPGADAHAGSSSGGAVSSCSDGGVCCSLSGATCGDNTRCCTGLACTAGRVCASSCLPKGASCTASGACCLGTYCDSAASHACVACLALMSSCTDSAQCCSGSCSSGHCLDT